MTTIDPITKPKMIAGWQEKIDAAQLITHLHDEHGVAFERIRYGNEVMYFGSVFDQVQHKIEITNPYCGDCAVAMGQIHVASCDWEQCPKCKGQLLSCDCNFQEA
jgi:hypothetical protein